jgi:mannose-6-phosphate isomerase-like protein (cupin superfamily)
MEPEIKKTTGKHFTAAHFGKFTDMHRYEINNPKLPRPLTGKVFLRQHLDFTGLEISLNNFKAGATMPFSHKHGTHEEAYVFVKGSGQIQIDGETIDVHEGSVVRIAPPASRIWRNNSKEDLYFVVIQAKEKTFAPDEKDGAIVPDPVTWKD